MKLPNLVAKASRLLPDLEELEDRLEKEPEMVISRAFPVEDPGERTLAVSEPEGETVLARAEQLDAGLERQREEYVYAAKRAVSKIRAKGEEADLEPEEAVGLEAIISIEGRPAILIKDGHFSRPPRQWEILEQTRASIENTCLSVGRIEVSRHPVFDWVGTGFVVAEDVIMTNRHVAEEFCRLDSPNQWVFKPRMRARIDYVEEHKRTTESEFALERVIGVHETFDLALFRVSRTSVQGSTPPEPLTLASRVSGALRDRNVYVVGYPARDPRNNRQIMARIFRNIYEIKRLQPGKVVRVLDQESLLHHDCSTLGGNSGSCVVDLETNQVFGLHFGGRYLEDNQAVALWKLIDDPLLKKAELHFG